MYRSFISIILAALLLTSIASSPALAVGEATGASLTISPGGRANGLGQAYVSLADDATAAWWNPAGLGAVKGKNISLMHASLLSDLYSDIYYEYFSYANEVGGIGALSFSMAYLTYGEIIAKRSPASPEIPFKAWEGYLMGSFGMRLAENLNFGLSLKFIYIDLAPAWATQSGRKGAGSSIALDVGTQWKTPGFKLWRLRIPKMRMGATVTNIGPDVNFIDKEQPNPLPTTLRVGVAFNPISDEISNLILTLDVEQSLLWLVQRHITTRETEIYHFGMEYQYVNLLAGRLGYVRDNEGGIKGMTYGLGFIYKGLRFDYASVPQNVELDRVNRWSIAVSF